MKNEIWKNYIDSVYMIDGIVGGNLRRVPATNFLFPNSPDSRKLPDDRYNGRQYRRTGFCRLNFGGIHQIDND